MNLQAQIFLIIIGQIFTILALFITNYINRRHTTKIFKEKIQIEKRVEYLEKQLNEFYSPMYSLLKINDEIVIKTRYDPKKGKYTKEVPEKIWEDLRDNVLIPNNKAMVELFKKNIHLIEGNDIPECFLSFIVHAEMWPLTHKYNTEFLEYRSKFSFPEEFKRLIYETTESLKREYYNLIEKS